MTGKEGQMEFTDLRDGCYRLPRPVLNPRPDGRRTIDWRAKKTFDAGHYIVSVSRWTRSFGNVEVTTSNVRIKRPGERGAISFYVTSNNSDATIAANVGGTTTAAIQLDQAKALVPLLVRDDSAEGLLAHARREYHVYGREVVSYLVEAGLISTDAVRLAIKAIYDAQVAEQERMEGTS